MLKTLKDLFDKLTETPDADPRAQEHALQLATAVMLVEVMRSGTGADAGERAAVLAALRDKFALGADEAARLTELAETTARESSDLFAFTSRINAHFGMEQKLRMVEHMWRVAYADGHLGDLERHVMWRVVDLLHVPKGANVHARMRARREAGLED